MATVGYYPISSFTRSSSSVSFPSNFPLTIESVHKNGSGSTKNSLDARAKRLGVSVYGDQIAHSGSIIVRQRATKSKRLFALPRRMSKVMAFYGLTSPPYKLNALEPYMSQRTLELHWGKHHQGYVESLNRQLVNNPLYGLTMEELIKKTYNNGNPLPEFNNAAQVWNHDFFWESMQPDGGNLPWGGVLQQIEKDFSSFSDFRDEFTQSALSLFGSGWVWLTLKRKEKRLSVIRTSNAISPLVWGDIPIIGLDMWEHAYYLDYKDDTEKYVSTFMDHLVSWHAAAARLARAEAFVNLGEPKVPVA